MRIIVDRERCIGMGMCEGLSLDIFRVGDDGIVRVSDPIPAEHISAAEQAVQRCPTEALRLGDE
ncbi:ferredoxin [Mycobacterium syngnathidarum]